MIPENSIQKKLFKVINESLELLKQASINEQKPAVIDIPIPGLLEQCLELCEEHHAQTQEPIRTVHHFGLPIDSPLLSSLATLPNTRVLTDIHPANNSFKDSITSQTFIAKSINSVYNTKVFNTAEEDEYRIKVFLNELQQTQQQSNQVGQRLLICDNHCLTQAGKIQSSDLLSLLKRQFTLRSLIVVTDPVDSYHAYSAQVLADTSPLDFEEYCQSIMNFIQSNPDLKVIRHEDFVADPEKVMGAICELLGLPVCEDFLGLGEVFKKTEEKRKVAKPEFTVNNYNSHHSLTYKLFNLLGYEHKKDFFFPENFYTRFHLLGESENKNVLEELELLGSSCYEEQKNIESIKVVVSEKKIYFCFFKDDYIPNIIKKTGNFYEAPFLKLLSKFYEPGKKIIDGGANIGNHSVFFSRIMGGKVISFEPQPLNFFLLRVNREINHLNDMIDIRNVAIGSKVGVIDIAISIENNYGTYTSRKDIIDKVRKDKSGCIYTVPVVTLDDELYNDINNISIIKLDVEGMELSVLEGASMVLSCSKPVVAVECFNYKLFSNINNYLSSFGYYVIESINATPTFIFLCKDNLYHSRVHAKYLEEKSLEKFSKKTTFNR